MLRVAMLALLVLTSVSALVPLADTSAERERKPSVSNRSKKAKRYYRARWRRQRARLKRRRAALARRRAVAAWRARQARSKVARRVYQARTKPPPALAPPPESPLISLPRGWIRSNETNHSLTFLIKSDDELHGRATLSFIRTASNVAPGASYSARQNNLAGVPHSELRRIVIDLMVVNKGWVVNDFSRDVGGRPAFLVVAQSETSAAGNSQLQSWIFYFMELDGRIYSLALSSAPHFTDRLRADAEKFLSSLRFGNRRVVAERNPR